MSSDADQEAPAVAGAGRGASSIGTRSTRAARLAGRCGGAVVGVRRGGSEEISCWGERVPGKPIGPDAVFDLASVTKLLTTLAVARALGMGRFTLATTVAELLAEPPAPGLDALAPTATAVDPAARHPRGLDAGTQDVGALDPGLAEVTVEQLLRHRSGLPAWLPLYLLPRPETEPPSAECADHLRPRSRSEHAALPHLLRLPPTTPPGSAFCYSDLGMILLGALLARRAGTGVGDLLARAGTELVGEAVVRCGGAPSDLAVASDHGDTIEREMVRSGSPHPVPAGLDVEGFGWRTHLLVGETDDGNAFHAFGGVAGHAGAFASVPDLLRLGTAALTALGEPGSAVGQGLATLLAAAPVDGQGLGFRVREGDTYWHPGFTGTALVLRPATGLVAALGSSRLLVEAPEPTVDLLTDCLADLW